MPFVPVPNTAQVQMVYAAAGVTAQNTLYFMRDAGWDEASLQALAEDCVEAWETNCAPHVTEDWALVRTIATNLESDVGLKQIWQPALAIQGGIVGVSAPANVTFAVKFAAPRRGRGINGRIFQIGLSETSVGVGTITSVYANAICAGWRDFAAEVEAASDCQHVICHKWAGNEPLDEGFTESVMAYTFSDLSIDSQKLRLPDHKKKKRKEPTPVP